MQAEETRLIRSQLMLLSRLSPQPPLADGRDERAFPRDWSLLIESLKSIGVAVLSYAGAISNRRISGMLRIQPLDGVDDECRRKQVFQRHPRPLQIARASIPRQLRGDAKTARNRC